MNNVNEIIKFVKSNSYFDYEGDENDLQFVTRENGSVGNEEPGKEDIIEGRRLSALLKQKFDNISVSLEVVDEWVHMFVSEKKEKVEVFSYAFKKDRDGCGFTESFNSMEELIKKYGGWIAIDWNEVVLKVSKINHFPNDRFNGSYSSHRLLICEFGQKEINKWGYDFYIIKTKTIK